MVTTPLEEQVGRPMVTTPLEEQEGRPVVTTPLGVVRGVQSVEADGEYHVFKGIPFAQPPVGDRRFKVNLRDWQIGVSNGHSTLTSWS